MGEREDRIMAGRRLGKTTLQHGVFLEEMRSMIEQAVRGKKQSMILYSHPDGMVEIRIQPATPKIPDANIVVIEEDQE